jgi:hypothetical protein
LKIIGCRPMPPGKEEEELFHKDIASETKKYANVSLN